jgi:hypothetical protein
MQLNLLKGIPYGRDEDLVGQDSILRQVKTKFETHRRLALIGLGGVGYELPPCSYGFFYFNGYIRESQISIEYAYRFLDDFLQASTEARFIHAYILQHGPTD